MCILWLIIYETILPINLFTERWLKRGIFKSDILFYNHLF